MQQKTDYLEHVFETLYPTDLPYQPMGLASELPPAEFFSSGDTVEVSIDHKVNEGSNLNNVVKTSQPRKKIKVIFVTDTFRQDWKEESFKESWGQDPFAADIIGFFDSNIEDLFIKMVKAMKLSAGEFKLLSLTKESTEQDLWEGLDEYAPDVVMTLGAQAMKFMLNLDERLAELHGEFYGCSQREDLKILPLFHPHVLAINPAMKKVTWQDMQKAMAIWSEKNA